MAQNPGPPAAQQTADRVAAIIAAAEEVAGQIRLKADERLRERLAEGDRAVQDRIRGAEDEAKKILAQARQEGQRLRDEAESLNAEAASQALTVVADAEATAERIVSEAQQSAADTQRKADERSRTLLWDARQTADGVRAEGLELVANLREMGNSLRINAERLLTDVQRVHARMTRDLEPDEGDRTRSGRHDLSEPSRGEVLDAPEFMP